MTDATAKRATERTERRARHALLALAALTAAVLACGCGDGASSADPRDAAAEAPPRDAVVDQTPRPDSGVDSAQADAPAADGPASPAPHRPVVLVHGINGSAKDFDVMVKRLIADGWPAERVLAITYDDPSWGCNVDNAATLAKRVKELLVKTGARRVDLVAHSMGSLSSRHFVKNLGGAALVNTYVTLGGMHHGLFPPCLSPLDVCVWKELCSSGPLITQLNAQPATPGKLYWVSIFGTADGSVPNDSSRLPGAENISLPGVEHSGPKGLLEAPSAYTEVKRVLQYPDW